MAFAVTDLPQPDSPTTQSVFPRLMSKVTPLITRLQRWLV